MEKLKLIKDLREDTGMNRKEFSELTGIPVRTLEDGKLTGELLKTQILII